MPYVTALDLIHHALDYLPSSPTTTVLRDCRRAVKAAYRELVNAHPWANLIRAGRIITDAPVSAGTVAYTHSSRTVTLTGGTWPSWAEYGLLLVNSNWYRVQTRSSDTALLLAETDNPGTDVAGGTAYSLYRDTYPLPDDAVAIDLMFDASDRGDLAFVGAQDLLHSRLNADLHGNPKYFTVLGDPKRFGGLAVRFVPWPATRQPHDFQYLRRPRSMSVDWYRSGTVTTAGTTTITGSGTKWTAALVGAVIRISNTAEDVAQSADDSDPTLFERMTLAAKFVYERRIVAVASDTSLTVDESVPALVNVAYVVSDPAEIEPGVMLTALERAIEKQIAIFRRLETFSTAVQLYEAELEVARMADRRFLGASRVMAADTRIQRTAEVPFQPPR